MYTYFLLIFFVLVFFARNKRLLADISYSAAVHFVAAVHICPEVAFHLFHRCSVGGELSQGSVWLCVCVCVLVLAPLEFRLTASLRLKYFVLIALLLLNRVRFVIQFLAVYIEILFQVLKIHNVVVNDLNVVLYLYNNLSFDLLINFSTNKMLKKYFSYKT